MIHDLSIEDGRGHGGPCQIGFGGVEDVGRQHDQIRQHALLQRSLSLLIERGEWIGAGSYIVGSVVLSIAALFAALWLVRSFA